MRCTGHLQKQPLRLQVPLRRGSSCSFSQSRFSCRYSMQKIRPASPCQAWSPPICMLRRDSTLTAEQPSRYHKHMVNDFVLHYAQMDGLPPFGPNLWCVCTSSKVTRSEMLTAHSYGSWSFAGSKLMMAHFRPRRLKYCCSPLQYVVFPLPGGPTTHCPKGMSAL